MFKKLYKKYLLISTPDFYEKNPRRFSKRKIVDELTYGAFLESICGYPTYRKVEDAVRTGKEIPEMAKPGRAIMRLSKEKREQIKKLNSQDFNDRQLFR